MLNLTILGLSLVIVVWVMQNRLVLPQIEQPSAPATVVITQPIAELEAPLPGLPVRLFISSIKVNAPIGQVGRTSQGAMGVPTTPSSTAWYRLGPRPGEVGSAVIDGHFGWYNNIPAVFDNLRKVKVGDRLTVVDDQGESIVFIVHHIRTFTLKDNPSDVFNSDDGQAHLNLITCQGVWNIARKSYSKRLVVFADQEKKL